MRLVLDAEGVNALVQDRHCSRRLVEHEIASALRFGREICIASVTLAELYRGTARVAALNALLARLEDHDVRLRDTDRRFACLVGSLLRSAGVGSAHLADAHAVAAAVEAGGGSVLTSDPDDLTRLADGDPRVVVVALSDWNHAPC